MGVHNLWDVVATAGIRQSLTKYMFDNAKARALAGDAPLVLGVDMQIVMCQCIAANQAMGIYSQSKGGALEIFFRKLCNLRKGLATLIFVSDGNLKPLIKRGNDVIDKEIWWMNHAIELILYFGCYHHQAPGEAEAELARLNKEGIIQGILTTDSDTLVFGGSTVLRMIPREERKVEDEIIVYTMDAIQEKMGASMSTSGLLLYALLAGGDYDDGVPGCGRATAEGLAKCGLGDDLVKALNDGHPLDDLTHVLSQKIKRELTENSHGNLQKKRPNLAKKVPVRFPNILTLQLYTNPTTSWSKGFSIPSRSRWTYQELDISNIYVFCITHFGWKSGEGPMVQLPKSLVEAVLLQMLSSPSITYNPVEKKLASPNVEARVVQASLKSRKGKYTFMGRQWRLSLCVEKFSQIMTHDCLPIAPKSGIILLWVPEDFLPDGVIQSIQGSKHREARGKIPNAARRGTKRKERPEGNFDSSGHCEGQETSERSTNLLVGNHSPSPITLESKIQSSNKHSRWVNTSIATYSQQNLYNDPSNEVIDLTETPLKDTRPRKLKHLGYLDLTID